MGHKDYCCVPGCGNRRDDKAGFSFYAIPLKPHDRHAAWLAAIGKGLDWVPTAHTRICSLHFVGGKKNNDPDNSSYVPTLHLDLPVPDDENRRRRRRSVNVTTSLLPLLASSKEKVAASVEKVTDNKNKKAGTSVVPQFESDGIRITSAESSSTSIIASNLSSVTTATHAKTKTVRSLLFDNNGTALSNDPDPAKNANFTSFIRSLSKENTLNMMKQSYVKIGADASTPCATVSVNPDSKPSFHDKNVFGSGSVWKDSNHSSKLLRGLEKLWKDGSFSDVVINVGYESFHAHRVVVAAASPFMSSLLSNVPARDKGVSIELPCDPRAMNEILRFMYTGTLTLKDETVYPILHSAQMLNIEKVRYMCEKYVDINKLENPEKTSNQHIKKCNEREWSGPKIESCYSLMNGKASENDESPNKRRKRKADFTKKMQPKLRIIGSSSDDRVVTVTKEPKWEWDDAPDEDPPLDNSECEAEEIDDKTDDANKLKVINSTAPEREVSGSRKRKSTPFKAAEPIKAEPVDPSDMKELLSLFATPEGELPSPDLGDFIKKLLDVHDKVSPTDISNIPVDENYSYDGDDVMLPYGPQQNKLKTKAPEETKKQQQGPFSHICTICFWRFPSIETTEKHIRKNHTEVQEFEIRSKVKHMRMMNASKEDRNLPKNAKKAFSDKCKEEMLPDDIMIARQFVSSTDRIIDKEGIKQKAALAYVCCHCDSKHESLPLCLEHVRDCTVRKTAKLKSDQTKKLDTSALFNSIDTVVDVQSPSKQKADSVKRDERGRILYHCDECQYKTTQKYYLPFHRYYKHNISLPEGIDVYECEVCQKKHPSAGALRDHMLYHSTSKDHQFVCNMCNEVFKTVTSLRDHTRRSHHLTNSDSPRKEKQYFECEYPNCIYRTRYKNKLYTHTQRHSGSQPEWLKPKSEPEDEPEEGAESDEEEEKFVPNVDDSTLCGNSLNQDEFALNSENENISNGG